MSEITAAIRELGNVYALPAVVQEQYMDDIRGKFPAEQQVDYAANANFVNALPQTERADRNVTLNAERLQGTQNSVAMVKGFTSSRAPKGGMNYLIPDTGHWFLVTRGFAYHLVFSLDDAGKVNGIRFDYISAANIIRGRDTEFSDAVGVTPFRTDTIVMIGKALISAFGNYHRLFWNGQNFALMLAMLICPHAVNLNRVILTATSVVAMVALPGNWSPTTKLGGGRGLLREIQKEVVNTAQANLSWELLDEPTKTRMAKLSSLIIENLYMERVPPEELPKKKATLGMRVSQVFSRLAGRERKGKGKGKATVTTTEEVATAEETAKQEVVTTEEAASSSGAIV
ncbi:hypothetical protein HK104_008110 [Borealophlyctis nickersoniae]|nr:hypothetical protein HK104_008110 [Borealophlyctis nickersoniae]